MLFQCRDLQAWANQTQAEMSAQQPINDLQTALQLRRSHDNLQVEIEARVSEFEKITCNANMMIEGDHYAADEVLVNGVVYLVFFWVK